MDKFSDIARLLNIHQSSSYFTHKQVEQKRPIWRNDSANSIFYYNILYHAKVYFMYIHVPTELRRSHLVIDVIHAGRSRTCADVGEATASGETRHVLCESQVAGDVVKIRTTGSTHQRLSLCDVHVFGSPRK